MALRLSSLRLGFFFTTEAPVRPTGAMHRRPRRKEPHVMLSGHMRDDKGDFY